MKKTLLVMLGIFSLFVFQNCSSSKKAAKVPPVSYTKDVMPILQASCTPCHFPPDGKKEALNTYDAVKKHIAEIIVMVKLPATDPKFMPFKSKKPALTAGEISVLEAWQKQNMPN